MGNNNTQSASSNSRGNSIIENSVNVDKIQKHSELDENDSKLVRTTWNQVKCSSDFKTLGTNLMVKIFINHPEVKYIWRFAANLKTEEEMRSSSQVRSHGYNVMEAVNAFINSLDKSESCKKLLFDLGSRHVSYGAKTNHFPIIGTALVETLKEALGEHWTDEVANAWSNTLSYLKMHMSKGLEYGKTENERA